MVRTVVIGCVAALAAGALVLAGCGGSDTVSQQEYAESVVSARDRVDFALAQITVGTGDVEDLIERMETAADQIDEAADDFDNGGPADGFEDETEELVAAFHQLAAGLAATAHDASVEGMEAISHRDERAAVPRLDEGEPHPRQPRRARHRRRAHRISLIARKSGDFLARGVSAERW